MPPGILGELAPRDLWGRRDWVTSATMLGTVVVVTAVCLASYGLVLGHWNVERKRIDRDAWALVLRVGNAQSTRGDITPELLEQLRNRLRERFAADPTVIRAIHPYRTCVDRISLFTYGQTTAELRGRTIHWDEKGLDLYLSGQEIAAPGTTFTSATDRGILITPKGLRKLGITSPPSPPFTLAAEIRIEQVPLNVIGIFQNDLPDHYDFVIPEQFEQTLLHGDPVSDYIVSEELPAEWLSGVGAIDWTDSSAWRTLPPEITDRLEGVELFGDRLRLQARVYFDETTNDVKSTLARSQWENLLRAIGAEMKRRTQIASTRFAELDSEGRATHAAAHAYDLVNVYMRKAEALSPAADICDALVPFDGQGTVNRDVIRRLASIDERLRESLRTIHVQQAVIVALSSLSLIVLQVFRALGKTREIGMLRAMGMKRRQVVGFIFLQAGMLAGIGAVFGLALGAATALGASLARYDSWQDAWAGVCIPWELPIAIVLGAFIVTLISGYLASWRWFIAEPASLMR